MYEIIPPKSNKSAQYFSIVLLVSAFAAMFFSSAIQPSYRSIIQFVSLVMLAFSILLMTRYVLSGYSYAIVKDDDEGYDLTVTELKRKSRITVCRISLSGIERVELVGADNKKAISSDSKKYKRFNYCVDLKPARYMCVFCEECGEKFAINLSFDQKLFDILSAAKDS